MFESTIRELSIEFLFEEGGKISVLVRKYETKAQNYENPNDKSEN